MSILTRDQLGYGDESTFLTAETLQIKSCLLDEATDKSAILYYNNATGYLCASVYTQVNKVLTHVTTATLFTGLIINTTTLTYAVCSYDTDKFIVFYYKQSGGFDYVYYRTYGLVAGAITELHSETIFKYFNIAKYLCACYMATNKVCVYYTSGTTATHMQHCQLASDAISWASTATAIATMSNFLAIASLSETHVLCSQNVDASAKGTARVASINWTSHSVSLGASVDINSGASVNDLQCELIDTTKFIIVFKYPLTSTGRYIIGTHNNRTITVGSPAQFTDNLVNLRVIKDTTTRALVFYANVYSGAANIGTGRYIDIDFTGYTGTVSDEFIFHQPATGGGTADKGMAALKTGSFIIAYQDDADSDYGKILGGEWETVDIMPLDIMPFLLPGEAPQRRFTIGASDYSDRVLQWPTINRTSESIKATNVKIPLANADQALNSFYNNLWTLNTSCELVITTTDSDQSFTVFKGFLLDVQYADEKCILQMKDRLWKLSSKSVGISSVPVSFSSQIPSDIGWTLCTCYGELDTTASSANVDIDYASFCKWAETFSRDSVNIVARFEGTKIAEALSELANMTNSMIWTDRNGKINFAAKLDTDSSDITFIDEWIIDVAVEIGTSRIVNKQHVYGLYDVDSMDWFINVVNVDSSSISSYDVYEDTIKSDMVWYTSSVDMLVLAGRRTGTLKTPPKTFSIKTPLMTIDSDIGDRIRFVDSFFSIDSSSPWRIIGNNLNMDTGVIEYELDGSMSSNPFQLDVSKLDGLDVLL